MTKPWGSADGVNAAVVHRGLMFLFGEICPTRRCLVSSSITSRAHWLTKVQAHGELPIRASEAGSGRATEHSAPRSNSRA